MKSGLAVKYVNADNFVVYQGFGLMEGKLDKDTAIQFAAVSIAADAQIVGQTPMSEPIQTRQEQPRGLQPSPTSK